MDGEGRLAESQLAEEDTSWKMDLPRDTGPAEDDAEDEFEDGAAAAAAAATAMAPHIQTHIQTLRPIESDELQQLTCAGFRIQVRRLFDREPHVQRQPSNFNLGCGDLPLGRRRADSGLDLLGHQQQLRRRSGWGLGQGSRGGGSKRSLG